MIMPYLNDLISFMVILPDNPELEYLGLFTGVTTAIELIKW
jgi:hypothetical protein